MKRGFWTKYHKWAGLVFCFFILMFCLSGIVLNHRQLFSGCEVSRWCLPKAYHYDNWNNGIVRGTFRLSDGRLLMYGNAGVWRTDSCFSCFTPMNAGLDDGIDNRKISNVVQTHDGHVWCAGLYAVYRLNGDSWQNIPLGYDAGRIADITTRGDSLVVVSRSHIYTALSNELRFTRHELKTPQGFEPQTTLFRTVWLLHSGELFGTVGKLVVDVLAIVIIVLCLTGLVYTFVPKMMKRRAKAKKGVKAFAATLKYSVKWHNKLGASLIVLTLLLTVTGMCLRPPLMIPLAMSKVKPLPSSTLSSDNAFNDKLRALRYDETTGKWLLSTSMGFYALDDFDSVPTEIKNAPRISPMGINVFERADSAEWIVGSFSGLYRWNPSSDKLVDYFTGKAPANGHGRPVSGYSRHLVFGDVVVFEYGGGAKSVGTHSRPLPQMPEELTAQPMSLWNFALELHVGRCYSPFLGPVSVLFVFLSGLILTLILLSGYIVYRRRKRPREPSTAVGIRNNKGVESHE